MSSSDPKTVLETRGANLRTLTGFAIDTTTASGRLIFHMAGAFAEFKRALIIERTNSGLAAAKRRGRVVGRAPVLTPTNEVASRVLLLAGNSVVKVAQKTGVSKSVIYLHRERLLSPDWQPRTEANDVK